MEYNPIAVLFEAQRYMKESHHPLDKRNAQIAEYAILANDRGFRDLYEQIGDNPHTLYCNYRSMWEASQVGFPMVARGYETTSFYQEAIEMLVVEIIKPCDENWNKIRIAKLPNGKYTFAYSFGTHTGSRSCGFRIGKEDLYKSIDAVKSAVSTMVETYFAKRKDCKQYKAWIRTLKDTQSKEPFKQLELF